MNPTSAPIPAPAPATDPAVAARRAFLLAALAGALATGVGGAALVGWAFDIATLKSIRPDWVSLKPNTAVAFILVGLALLLALRGRSELGGRTTDVGGRRPKVIGFLARLCGLLAGLIGLLSLAEYAFNWNPGFDRWLFPEPAGTIGTSHPGRMAPDTALCFMVFAVGWNLLHHPSPQRKREFFVSLLAGFLIVTAGLVEILFYCVPLLRAHGWGGLTMMALPTATVFLALGAALIALAVRHRISAHGSAAPAFPWSADPTGLKLLLIFAGLAAGIVATGTAYYRSFEQHHRDEVEGQLAAIADLKSGELKQWRQERLGDAGILFQNAAISNLVRRTLADPADADALKQLAMWLGKYGTHFRYDRIRLLDPHGTTRLSWPVVLPPPSPIVIEGAAEALRSGQVTLQDFYFSGDDNQARLALLIPVLDEADGNRPLGVLVLRINPEYYLFPLIQRWPMASPTAETLLVRKEGNEVIFLNELRFRKDAPMTIRIPLDQVRVPAVQAALGRQGVMDGIDYRGLPVVAVMRTIPDSPWALVARIDTAEVLAILRAERWQVVGMVGTLLFGTVAGVGLVWRRRRDVFYQSQTRVLQALEESESLLNETGRTAKIGGWAIDLTTRELRWTKQVYTLHEVGLGFQPTVEAAVNYFVPESRSVIQQAVERAIQFGEPFDLELEVITAKQRRLWVQAAGHADYEAGKVKRIVGVLQDITERKQAEEVLRENELKYRALFETADGAILLFAEGRWVDCNAGALKVFGCTREQIIGAHPSRFSPPTQPDGRPSEETAVQLITLAFTGQPQAFEWEHCRLDGTTFAAEVSLNRLDLGGKPHIQAIVRDISERKRAAAALVAEKQNLEALFASSPVAMFILDETTKIVRVNDAAIALSDNRLENVLDHRPGDALACLHSMEDPRGCGYSKACRVCATRRGIEGLLANGGHLHGVELAFDLVRHDVTQKVWMKIGAEPIQMDGRRHLIVAMDDVTERTQALEKIQQLNASLEQRVRERTAELEASNKELEAFSYSVSHDLRAPLRGIDGFSRIVLEDYEAKLDAEGRDSLHRIRAAAQRMAQLIDDMLSLSRISRAELRRERVDLSHLARAVTIELQRHEAGRTVELVLADGIAVEGDPQLLTVVLENLLGNAWKFTGRRDQARIEFGALRQDGRVNCFVRDNGAGFDPAYAEKLFTAFQRLHPSAEFAGTGIGLANVQRIIHRHGGRVWADGAVNQGATFWFTLSAPAPAERASL